MRRMSAADMATVHIVLAAPLGDALARRLLARADASAQALKIAPWGTRVAAPAVALTLLIGYLGN